MERDDDKISVNRDPNFLGGTLVFSSTRVSVRVLWNHLGAGIQLDEFLVDSPTVPQEQAAAVLASVAEMLLPNLRANITQDEVQLLQFTLD